MQLVLASSSTYRAGQLERIGLQFETDAPDIDESRHRDEAPDALVLRLSAAKAAVVADRHPGTDVIVVAGDQIACLDDQILGKPGNRDAAIAQLLAQSGRTVSFLSGLCVRSQTRVDCIIEPVHVQFRNLTRAQIEAYVDQDRPYDCSGALRSEGAGATLIEHIRTNDPNALIGVPIFQLCTLLGRHGLSLPSGTSPS